MTVRLTPVAFVWGKAIGNRRQSALSTIVVVKKVTGIE